MYRARAMGANRRYTCDGPRPSYRSRHRITWRHVPALVLALAIGVYGGLLLASALFTR